MSDSIFGINRIIIGAAAARLLGRPFPIADTDSDESFAARVRSDGSHQAFEILVARYRPRLCALVRAMTDAAGAGGEVDDIVQDVFVRAYAGIRTYNPSKQFRPWLYRIAVNQVLDRRRAGARRPEVAIPADDVLLDSQAPSADPAVSEERMALMARCVSELPVAMRVVFLLRTIDDLSYEEIAVAVGTPVGTVKTNLFRARARLREALRDYFDVLSCTHYENLMQVAADGRLDATRREELDAHLAACPSCRSAFDEMRALASLAAGYARLLTPEYSSDAQRRIMDAIAAMPAPSRAPILAAILRRPALAAGLAVAAAAFAVAILSAVTGAIHALHTAGLNLPSLQFALPESLSSGSRSLLPAIDIPTAYRAWCLPGLLIALAVNGILFACARTGSLRASRL